MANSFYNLAIVMLKVFKKQKQINKPIAIVKPTIREETQQVSYRTRLIRIVQQRRLAEEVQTTETETETDNEEYTVRNNLWSSELTLSSSSVESEINDGATLMNRVQRPTEDEEW